MIHLVWVVASGYYILKLSAGVAVQFILITLISFGLTMLSYEIIRRIPGLRFIFNIKGMRRKETVGQAGDRLT